MTPTTITYIGALPSGVAFTDHGDGTATLAGSPTFGTGGTCSITLTASNGVAADATQLLTIEVDQAPVITSADHASFATNAAAAFTVTTAGAVPAATTLTVTGTVPGGVAFTDNGDGTGTLAGTPTAGSGGVYRFQVTAANGAIAPVNQDLTLTVDAPPIIASVDHETFTAGLHGHFSITIESGYPDTTTLSANGALPAGIRLTDNGDGTATPVGTPKLSALGRHLITLTASNGVAPDPTQRFQLRVRRAATVLLPVAPPHPDGRVNTIPRQVRVGTVLHLHGSGYAAGAPITVGVDSTPRVLAHTYANRYGSFAVRVRVPARLGRHAFLAAGTGTDGSPRFLAKKTTILRARHHA